VRIEYTEAFYHVMARGNRREGIFRDEHCRFCCAGKSATGAQNGSPESQNGVLESSNGA
jgi:hypothetical protein